MKAKRSHLSVALAALFLGLAAGADTYDEKLEFLETTGTQWVDTGLRLNFRRARLEARFRMLEIPSSLQALCGALDKKDNYGGRDYTKGATLRSFAVRVGYSSNPDIRANRLTLGWTGGEGPGFVAGVDTAGGYEVKIDCTTGSVNRTVSCGAPELVDYSWRYRPDELIGADRTYYIGNINNAGEGLATASGSMPKVHWYGLRLWHDDTLIGDFIPVKKAGVAGFFDNVSRTFLPSQGADPFVAPKRIVWTGGGQAGNLMDGANWQGGVAPSATRDVAVIPPDLAAEGSYTDIATLATIGGVDVRGENSFLGFTAATQSPGKAWAAPFYGKGTVRFAGIPSAYGCAFNADSSSFEGLVDISNAVVTLNRLYAFGGAKANVRYFSNVSDQRLNIKTSVAPLPPTFTFRRTGQFVFADMGAYFDGRVVFDPVGTLTFHGNGDHKVVFAGPVTNRSASVSDLVFESADLRFAGEPKHIGGLRLRAGIARISAPLRYSVLPKVSGIKSQSNLSIWPASTGLVFGTDDALGEYASLLVNYDYNLYDTKKRHVNLNGHDLTIGTLGIHSENWFCWDDPTKNHLATNTIIWSDTPATLTLAGYCRNSMLDPEKSYVYPGQLNGALNFVLDSRADVMATAYDSLPDDCGIIRFTGTLSTTTGRVAVTRGLIDIRSQAAFPNLTELAAVNVGRLIVRTPTVGNAGTGLLVRVTDSASLEIAENVTLSAKRAQVGKWLPRGTFGSAEAVAAAGRGTALPKLKGLGLLTVAEYGGPLGLVMVIP